jgi:hypothetical protein
VEPQLHNVVWEDGLYFDVHVELRIVFCGFIMAVLLHQKDPWGDWLQQTPQH